MRCRVLFYRPRAAMDRREPPSAPAGITKPIPELRAQIATDHEHARLLDARARHARIVATLQTVDPSDQDLDRLKHLEHIVGVYVNQCRRRRQVRMQIEPPKFLYEMAFGRNFL